MENKKFDFNAEFSTDEEVEEALDALIIFTAEELKKQDDRPCVINPSKIKQVLYTYKVLKYLTRGQKGVKVEYKLNSPYKSMGYVSVTGKHPTFRKPEWFMRAAELSGNFEVYPKTNGTVQMNFTFHGLTVPMD